MKVDVFFDKAARFLVDPVNPKNQHPKLAVAVTTILGLLTVGIAQGLSLLWRSLRPVKEKNKTMEAISHLFHKTHLKPYQSREKNEIQPPVDPKNDFSSGSASGQSHEPINSPTSSASTATSQTNSTQPPSSFGVVQSSPGSSQAASGGASGRVSLPLQGFASQSVPVSSSSDAANGSAFSASSSHAAAPVSVPPTSSTAIPSIMSQENLLKLNNYFLNDGLHFSVENENYFVYYNPTYKAINIQHRDNFYDKNQNNKIGFKLSSQGSLESLFVNGTSSPSPSLTAIPSQLLSPLALAVQHVLDLETKESAVPTSPSEETPAAAKSSLPPEFASEVLRKFRAYFSESGQPFFVPKLAFAPNKFAVCWNASKQAIQIQPEADYLAGNASKAIYVKIGTNGELERISSGSTTLTAPISQIPETEQKAILAALKEIRLLIDGEISCQTRGLTGENLAKICGYFKETLDHYKKLAIPFIVQAPDSSEYEVAFDSGKSELLMTKQAISADGSRDTIAFKFSGDATRITGVKLNGKQERGIQHVARLSENQQDILAAVLKEVQFEEDLAYNLLAFQVVLDEVKKKKEEANVALVTAGKKPERADEILYIPLKYDLPEEPKDKSERSNYLTGWFARVVDQAGMKAINFQTTNHYFDAKMTEKIGIRFNEGNGSIMSVWVDSQDTGFIKIPFKFYPLIRAGLRQAFKESSVYKMEGSAGVTINVLSPGLLAVPEYHVKELNRVILESITSGKKKPYLKTKFLRSNLTEGTGIDAGGLTKEFLDSLAQGITESKQLSFAKAKEGKIALARVIDGNKAISTLTSSEADIYSELGKFMMFCFHSEPIVFDWGYTDYSSVYALGKHFHPLMFRAILSLTKDEINTPFESLSEQTKLKLCDALIGDDDQYNRRLLNVLKNDVSSDKELQSVAEDLLGIEFLRDEFLDDEGGVDLDKIKANKSKFKENVKFALLSPPDQSANLGRQLAPIHAIAGGMLRYNQALGMSINSNAPISSQQYLAFSTKIQGKLDRPTIINSFKDETHNAEIAKKVGWLKNWLAASTTTEDEVRLFLKWVTGSTSFRQSDKIQIGSQGYFQSNPIPGTHTCFNQIDISPVPCGFDDGLNDKSEEKFIECIRDAIQPSKTSNYSMG